MRYSKFYANSKAHMQIPCQFPRDFTDPCARAGGAMISMHIVFFSSHSVFFLRLCFSRHIIFFKLFWFSFCDSVFFPLEGGGLGGLVVACGWRVIQLVIGWWVLVFLAGCFMLLDACYVFVSGWLCYLAFVMWVMVY